MVKTNFSFNFRLSYLYDCIFLNSLVIFKHFLDLYLGYVANQGEANVDVVGHFRVPKYVVFKTGLSAKPFLRK